MNGSTVQNHISFKMVFEYCVIRKFSYQSWFLVYLQLPQARLLQHPRLLQVRKLIIQIAIKQSSQVKVWIDKHGDTSETPEGLFREPTEVPKPNKNENHEQVRGSPCSDIPEMLQEFREILVDDGVPEHTDSHASSSHEPSIEPVRNEDLGRHSVYTHFPKDRNCEICQRTKITRAPCRRRIDRVVLRAENFGDLITADYKVLSENCESRNNHRYAVVVQDLATQWIQSYLCKTKTFKETQRSLQRRIPKSFTLTIPWNSAKLVKISPGIIARSTPHRSETNVIAERAVLRVKEGTSAVLLQSGLNESW